MKIAILGTRGIPNSYGGFEQCAEVVGAYMVKKGHQVTVYNPSDHGYMSSDLNGIKIQQIFSNERLLSFVNVFVFDYLCLRHAIGADFDVILELGYHPASLFYFLNKGGRSKIITNMAGMEWKRSKWNRATQKLIRYCEKLCVDYSDEIISDNKGIQRYFMNEYGKESHMIEYGAELFSDPQSGYLEQYRLEKHSYYMLLARFQPDNNIEMVLDGYILANKDEPFIVIGGFDNKYGRYLLQKYKGSGKIKFLGGIYDYGKLCSLRWFSKIYFHVHSCGGTNPSLLEAMASNAYIAAYDNEFNANVLGDEGVYFANSVEVEKIIRMGINRDIRDKVIETNREKIENWYNWNRISDSYLKLCEKVSFN